MGAHEELHTELAQRVTMHRRRFLGLLAAGTGAVVLSACSSDSAGDGDGMSGTKNGSETTATSGGKGAASVEPLDAPAADGIDADPFTLGVASGDPLATSVILWTKLATDIEDATGFGGLGETDHSVVWEVSADKDFATLVATGVEPAGAEFGHSVHADATGLEPDTWYWYRFRIGDFTSPVGHTRTLPAEDAAVEELRFVFASCQLRTRGYWTAYDHVVDDAPDLVAFLGDYIYEYPGGDGDLKIPLTDEPATLADYRVLYATYKRDPKIQAAHQVAPWVVTADDHEVENNYAGEIPEKAEDDATFAARKKAAYQAFWENHAIRIDPPAADGSLQVYRSFRWGDLAEFFVLDGRQYRDDQVCGDNIGTNANDCTELTDESLSMLGAEQESWLDNGLTGSTATWKVLAQQTVMKALKIGPIVLNVDQWDGYPAARTRLLTTIADNKIDNVIVLTGDIHAGGAADIRLPDAGITGDIVAHEFVAPGISSAGFGAIAQDLDLSGMGLGYANFIDNGYVRCTVTPATWQTEFVIVDSIETPTSDASVDATVSVTAGTAGITRA